MLRRTILKGSEVLQENTNIGQHSAHSFSEEGESTPNSGDALYTNIDNVCLSNKGKNPMEESLDFLSTDRSSRENNVDAFHTESEPMESVGVCSMDDGQDSMQSRRESMEEGLDSLNTDRLEELFSVREGELTKHPVDEDMKIAIEDFDISALEENLLKEVRFM